MHDAVRLGRYRIVKSLILYGANLRVKNQQGKTPVDMVQLWYKDTAQALSGNTEARKEWCKIKILAFLLISNA